jgi:predicted RNase H-like HicB family nuclease
MKSHYTIIIQWSDEDQCYVVSLPEWGECFFRKCFALGSMC